ncbi:MAG TPA: hypothetical protein PKW66_29065, partial [Polyangiaceae bacterium]|nr:hypothetical protein [Polyangiaceae bacterium]
MPHPPWKSREGLACVIEDWLASRIIQPCFAAERSFAPSQAQTVDLPEDLAPCLRQALAKRSIV